MIFNEDDFRAESFALGLEWNALPQHVQDRALMCSTDLMCALILGSQSKQYGSGVSIAKSMGMNGDIPLIARDDALNLLGAAIAYGHASNSFDIDDGFNLVKGHPGASFVGGTLAAALDRNASYEDYLATLVACYEVGIRWGLAMQEHYGFLHSTGAYGAFGTALGVGRLEGLDEQMLKRALSIADYHAPMTPVMRAVEYPSMNKDGVPFGALVGTMSVLEAINGVTGRTHLLECPEYSHLLATLGERFYMEELYFKPFTCCRWAHQPITLCLSLMEEHGFGADDVTSVMVHTFASAAALSKEKPKDTDEAQYNIAYPVACAIVHGDVGYDQVRDEAVSDPRVLEMMDKLDFVIDDDLDALFPEKRMAWVEISLEDGRVIKSSAIEAPGEATDESLSLKWAQDKLRKRTASLLTVDAQDEIIGWLEDPAGRVRDLISLIDEGISS